MPQSYQDARIRMESGIQEELVISAIPVGATGVKVGDRLRGATLTTPGDYYAQVDVGGLSEVEVHLRASAITGTLTSDVYTTFYDGSTKKSAFTGAGAMTATTRQSSTLSNPKGAQTVVVKLTVVTGPAVIDQAEINAL